MTIKLNAKKREVFGKKVKIGRDRGELPIIVYGAKSPAMAFSVNAAEFGKVWNEAGESSVVELACANESKDVLIHDVQFDPVRGQAIHADFLVIDKDKKIEVPVPLVFDGVASAVKELACNLVKVLHEIQVEALPRDLPRDIKVDISVLTTLDSRILIKDLTLPAGVALISNPEEVVASITEAGEEVVEEETPVDLSAIEVEKKGKTEEEGGGEVASESE